MVLQSHHRKFINYATTIASQQYCSDLCDDSDDYDSCLKNCKNFSYYSPPPPSPPPIHHPSKTRNFLIISLTLLAAALLAVALYVVYIKWQDSRRRRRRSRSDINQTHEEFLDQGPVVDHHVWYIQTVGLQPSVISSISVCKYKKGEGLVEGTECSVCLNEFQEDETLRLLPKCSHAFHISCIDTWLRSHTNCPMCRAPIVKNSGRGSSSSSASSSSAAATGNGNSSSGVESGDTQMGILEENDLGDDVVEEEAEMVEMQPMRRSVSLDSLSALKISEALTNSVDSGETTETKRVTSRNDSLARFVANSSIRRSLSCSGKLFLSRGREAN